MANRDDLIRLIVIHIAQGLPRGEDGDEQTQLQNVRRTQNLYLAFQHTEPPAEFLLAKIARNREVFEAVLGLFVHCSEQSLVYILESLLMIPAHDAKLAALKGVISNILAFAVPAGAARGFAVSHAAFLKFCVRRSFNVGCMDWQTRWEDYELFDVCGTAPLQRYYEYVRTLYVYGDLPDKGVLGTEPLMELIDPTWDIILDDRRGSRDKKLVFSVPTPEFRKGLYVGDPADAGNCMEYVTVEGGDIMSYMMDMYRLNRWTPGSRCSTLDCLLELNFFTLKTLQRRLAHVDYHERHRQYLTDSTYAKMMTRPVLPIENLGMLDY